MCVSVSVASSFHHIISLGTACGDSVFCGLGTASGDSCQFFSFRLLMSLGTASGDSVFCSVTYLCESSGAASGDSFVQFDFIASFLCCSGTASGDPCHFISKVIYGAELEETISNFGTFICTYICMYITHQAALCGGSLELHARASLPLCTPAPKVVCI